jgi:hypothetical protein
MPNHELAQQTFDFQFLREINNNFEADRPLMVANGRPDLIFTKTSTGYETRETADSKRVDMSKPKEQLLGEIEELNGRSEYGYLAAEENYLDDQQQEMADVIMFVLKCELFLKATPWRDRLELDGEKIEELTSEWLKDFDIPRVLPEEPLARVRNLSATELEAFEELKAEVTYYGNRLKALPDTELTLRDCLQIKQVLEYMVSAVFAMYHLLGVNPVRQAAEKVARNFLKYVAQMFSIEYVPEVSEDVPLSERAEIYRQAFKRQVKKVPDLWDGPVPTDEAGNVLRDEAGRPLPRPGYGSNGFYDYQIETQTDDGEGFDRKSAEVQQLVRPQAGGEHIIFDQSHRDL